MSNLSLTGNPGTSLNFDGAELQNLQEAECRKEEEQQQNELRALLTNAFDDLIDEDDILSITSEEGTDSRNVSLIQRASNDSFGRLTGDNKVNEVADTDNDWGGGYFQGPNPGPLPRFDFNVPMSRTQEFPRAQFDIVRASVESLPNLRASHEPDSDIHSNPSFHGSRDQLDSDYHSNTEETTNRKADFHGNVYPSENHVPNGAQPRNKKKKGQRKGVKEDQGELNSDTAQSGHAEANRISTKERENILRKSIEDFAKLKHEALSIQGNEQFYGVHGNPDEGQSNQFQGQGHGHQFQDHHHWHANSNQHVAEQPYDQSNPVHHQQMGHVHGQGHYYPDYQGQGHAFAQGQEHLHHGYNQPNTDHHHHFRNIYEGRPYHTIGEREETEGGNVGAAEHAYHVQNHYGYYQNISGPFSNSTDGGFYPHPQGQPPQATPNEYQQGHPNIAREDVNQNNSNGNQNEHNFKNPLSPTQSLEGFPEGYRVSYQKGKDDKEKGAKRDKAAEKNPEKRQPDKPKDGGVEKDFMQQVGTADDQQMAQLQILYKARGSKIEDLVNEMDLLKQGMGREIRILKHHLSMAKGEKEGATKSLDSCQELLTESKSENAQLLGRVHAAESQIEGLKKGKEELIKKLQTAESTIETLHQHLEELGRSDSLSRARHEHDVVVGGLQKKHETEIKVLKEKLDKLNESVNEKDEELSTLKQKLADSRKTSENLQISRAETINRLTQSLEESQKRCRNLLESTASQDLSQMKVQLQQALASKSISEEMCCGLQDEIKDLKEQVQMMESASSLGINGHASSGSVGFVDQNDSLIDLGIKKTLDFDTPQGTPTVLRSHSAINTSSEVVTSLKAELERCLISNRQKRAQVMELKDDLKTLKKDLAEYKLRCDKADILTQEQKKRISELESCMSPGNNVIENRLKKDIENLKREKKVLLEEVEEMQKRLDEISKSEEKLTELNQELSKQIADMVKEYDEDKREAVERVQRACDQVSETSRTQLREEMTLHFDTERSALIAKYEKERNALREELQAAETEIDRVKSVYVALCEDREKLEINLTEEWKERLNTELKQLKDSLGKEHSLATLRLEETLEKKREEEIDKLRQDFSTEKDAEITKLKTDFENERIKLETEKLEGIEKLQDAVKKELESEKSKLKTEFENEKVKIQCEKLDEIERITNEFKKRSVEIQEKDEVISVKDFEIIKIKEKYETEMKYLNDKFEQQLKTQKETAEREKNVLQEKLENEIKTLQDILEKEKLNDIEKVKKEKSNEIERLKQEIDKLKCEIERLNKELEEQMAEGVRTDKENKAVIHRLNKEMLEEKEKVQKSVNIELENRSVIEKLKEKDVEIERIREMSDKENKALVEKLMEKDVELEKTKEFSSKENSAILNTLKDKESEIQRKDNEYLSEIESLKKVKKEFENTLKEKEAEIQRKDNEYSSEIERLKKAKEECEKQLESSADKMKILKSEYQKDVRMEMELELQKTVETKVAMSKVVWLEEHRATRQTAIDNAVRLAEAELKQRMEEDVEARVEKRLQEAQLTWKSESLHQLEEERCNWELLKQEAIKSSLEQEHKRWRETELNQELENEKQKWTQELEVKFEQDKESWKVIELETEKLNWTLDWEDKLKKEKEHWIKNELEPAKQKWKLESEEKLRLEKDNWRCLELEPEKLKLMQELEERINKEKKSWMVKVLPEELKKEKTKWDREYIDRLQKEKESWHTYELPKELAKERKKWLNEVDDKITSEKKNWKNAELPEEIERERRKWMKLLESTLTKEKEKWQTQDLPSALEKERENWKKTLHEEVEKKLMQRLEVEKDKLQKESETRVLEAIDEHQEACKEELKLTIAKEKDRLKQKSDAELQERFSAEKKIWKEMVDQELSQKLEIEKEKWKKASKDELSKKLDSEKEKLKSVAMAEIEQKLKQQVDIEKEKLKKASKDEFNKKLDSEKEKLKSVAMAEIEQKVKQQVDIEKEKLKQDSEAEFNKKLESEKEKLKSVAMAEIEQKVKQQVDIEKEKLKKDSEVELDEKLELEKEKLKAAVTTEMGMKVDEEKQKLRELNDENRQKLKGALEEEIVLEKQRLNEFYEENKLKLKEKFEEEFKRKFQEEIMKFKTRIEEENKENLEKLRIKLEEEAKDTLETEKEILHLRSQRELSVKLESEESNWKLQFEKELGEKLQKEEEKWKEMIENDLETRLRMEKEKWNAKKEIELEERLQEERIKLQTINDNKHKEKMNELKERLEGQIRENMDAEMEKFRLDVEHEFHQRLEHEVNLAINDAKDDWQREYLMEMSINTTSAEASQGLLREEIESLKEKTESLQSELLKREDEWLKEKQDLIAQKEDERRKAVAVIQDQNEAEYKQFIAEHKDTLDHALKAAREQHTKEKSRKQAELEEQHKSQITALQSREKTLQQQLQESLHSTKDQSEALIESDQERMLWYEEREQLLQDIADRDALLGKADVHLSKEIEKFRSELQATYQRRLESEMLGWKQKLESEYSRVTNAEQKEKLQLEKQLSEVTSELNKVKTLVKEEAVKHAEEVKKLHNEINERKKKSDVEKVESELRQAKELVSGFKGEAEDYQEKCQRYKVDLEELQGKMSRMVQNQEKLQAELQKMKEEKTTLIESVQSIEASYHKDVNMYRQSQEDSTARIAKTENVLQSMKQKYRTELENLRKALEAENDVAMEAMKNKMIELQKKHVAVIDAIKKKHVQEKEELMTKAGSATLVTRGVTPTAQQGDSEDIDEVVLELRKQYLSTVTKIKDDVLRHVTHTNVRAAETVKTEMDKERSSTFHQIKDFYKNNVRQILETEIIGSNLESKLMAVEEALETLSNQSNPNSRSATPKSDDFCLDDRGMKILSRSTPRDAGISPQSQRQVSFTSDRREGERSGSGTGRSRTPVNAGQGHTQEMSVMSPERQESRADDPRSPKSRMERAKSPRDVHITVRERRPEVNVRSSREWHYDGQSRDVDSRSSQQHPLSAKLHREFVTYRGRDFDGQDYRNGDDFVSRDTDSSQHLGQQLGHRFVDKRRSRVVISTRDIHSGRYRHTGTESASFRTKSVTPLTSSQAVSSPSLYRPTSVPDLTGDEKELKVWEDTNNDNTYRYTSLRDTLRTGSNLTRSNSKSESDLRIAESSGGFAPLRAYDSTNLDLSTGSLSSCDTYASDRGIRPRDAGETPTSTPRRYKPRKHYTVDSFPTRDPITGEFSTPSKADFSILSKTDTSTPNAPREKRNLPLIQFRQGKMQTLSRTPVPNSKSPHADNQPMLDTASSDHRYRPLSVSSNLQMDL